MNRSRELYSLGLPEEQNVADISEITRTNLRSGGTFVSCGGESTLEHKVAYLSGRGGMEEKVADLSDIMRPHHRGGTFVSSGGDRSSRPLSGPQRTFLGQDADQKVTDLSQITRTGHRKGGTYVSSGGKALDLNRQIPSGRARSSTRQRPPPRVDDVDSKVTDLSQITRTGHRKGGTYMRSSGRPLSARPPTFRQAGPDDKVTDLSQITRPHLRSGRTHVSSAGRAITPTAADRLYQGEHREAVHDISSIVRPHLRSGRSFVSSAGPPLHAAYAGQNHLYDRETCQSVNRSTMW